MLVLEHFSGPPPINMRRIFKLENRAGGRCKKLKQGRDSLSVDKSPVKRQIETSHVMTEQYSGHASILFKRDALVKRNEKSH